LTSAVYNALYEAKDYVICHSNLFTFHKYVLYQIFISI